MIEVVKAGLLTTVQDQGRPGHRACGMPVSGALDAESYALANLLAGNRPGAAALEQTLLGGTFRFTRDHYVALAGADVRAALDGSPVASGSAFPVGAGSVLACGAAQGGARAYLAVRGGIDVPRVLGSRSTYTRARVGGLDGRALEAGDVLRVGPARGSPPPARALPPALMRRRDRDVRLRAVPGPQDDRFTADAVETFFGSPFTVSNRNDRMGYVLEGAVLRHAGAPDIVSEGAVPGAVQVPGSGAPVVLLADCPTVGGYAKIAVVAAADLGRLAQARRGDVVRFVRCDVAEAVNALRRLRARLDAAAASVAAAAAQARPRRSAARPGLPARGRRGDVA